MFVMLNNNNNNCNNNNQQTNKIKLKQLVEQLKVELFHEIHSSIYSFNCVSSCFVMSNRMICDAFCFFKSLPHRYFTRLSIYIYLRLQLLQQSVAQQQQPEQ